MCARATGMIASTCDCFSVDEMRARSVSTLRKSFGWVCVCVFVWWYDECAAYALWGGGCTVCNIWASVGCLVAGCIHHHQQQRGIERGM